MKASSRPWKSCKTASVPGGSERGGELSGIRSPPRSPCRSTPPWRRPYSRASCSVGGQHLLPASGSGAAGTGAALLASSIAGWVSGSACDCARSISHLSRRRTFSERDGATNERTHERLERCQRTRNFPFMPAAAWPWTVQTYLELPLLRRTEMEVDLPLRMSLLFFPAIFEFVLDRALM